MSISRYSRAALRASTTLSLALISASVSAQEAAQQQTNENPTTMLDEIIVNAGKEKVAIDTPQSVSAVGQEEIDAAQASTLGEIIDALPGVSVTNPDATFGQGFNIRGIGGAFAADESRIIIQVDGVKKYFEQYRMGSLFTDPELMKRVEVLRGPASSTLYGAGAIAGVIALETKDASDFLTGDDKYAVRAKTSWESNGNSPLASIITAVRPTEDLEFLANFQYRKSGNYDAAKGKELENGDITSLSGLAKLGYTFGENRDQKIEASYQRLYADGKDLPYDQLTYSDAFGLTDRVVDDQTVALSYENTFYGNDLLDIEAQVSYSDTEVDQKHPGNIYFGDRAKYSYTTWQANLQNTSRFDLSENVETYFTYGGEYLNRERLNPRYRPGGVVQPGSGSHPEGKTELVGVFGQAEIVIGEKLTLTPGMRIDYTRLQPGDGVASDEELKKFAYSPKIAALYKVNHWFGVFGSIAHTERLPTVDESFSNGNIVGGNLQHLDLEKSNNFEAGFSLSFDDTLQQDDAIRFKATGFYNIIENHISTIFDGTFARTVITEEALLRGLELEAAYDSPNWYGSFGSTITRGNDTSGDKDKYLESVAADNGFLRVGYKYQPWDVDVSWRMDVYAPQNRTEDPNNKTPGYALHQANLSWKPQEGAFSGAEVRASVTNIFDQKYQSHLSSSDGKGRSFKLSLAKTF
ncbi:TonB-dependent receptor domain-containing protein [Pseudovibrio ascidiaceicola]|uniref:TonB-dependent receptor domain-containing protein n=1 Tax=Pseudovibrio ascidiaceicola TaxID=285279 RepID=UPI000D68BBA3|nr:TonB-dependent receptor [Pseudovibrio ascidiaceicola]